MPPDHIPQKVLGKLAPKRDGRNLMAARYLASVFPAAYDFEKGRRPIPSRTYGNDSYGDCTLASQANCVARLERIEQRRTILLPDQAVISNYLEMTGGADDGWYELDAIKRWRTIGLKLASGRSYTIDGFTEINPRNVDEIKAAIYQFKVVKLCFGLPIAWAHVDPVGFAAPGSTEGKWDVGDGPDYDLYSWGGHSMSADAYTAEGVWVLHTWYVSQMSVRQLVTWEAVTRYCDEAYSVVDSFDAWRRRMALFDVNSLKTDVTNITSS